MIFLVSIFFAKIFSQKFCGKIVFSSCQKKVTNVTNELQLEGSLSYDDCAFDTDRVAVAVCTPIHPCGPWVELEEKMGHKIRGVRVCQNEECCLPQNRDRTGAANIGLQFRRLLRFQGWKQVLLPSKKPKTKMCSMLLTLAYEARGWTAVKRSSFIFDKV